MNTFWQILRSLVPVGRRPPIQLLLPLEPIGMGEPPLRRVRWLEFAAVVMGLALAARLAQLQVVQGADWRRAAEENRLRILRLPAPRGAILDCRGRLLAGSRPAFWLTATAKSPREKALLARGLAPLLREPARVIAARLEEPGPLGPVVVKADITPAQLAAVAELAPYLPGVQVQVRPVRFYPRGKVGAHAIGYVREINAGELARLRRKGYRMGDSIGKAGVEVKYEHLLRGRDGADQVEVDRFGRTMKVLGRVPPRPGRELRLTLDAALESAAQEELAGKAGAVVVMDCRTGAVLAQASSPAYDANIFVGALTPRQWAAVSGPQRPQNNRAVQGRYEPGSVFKIVTALAALGSGKVNAGSRFFCPGYYRVGSHKFHCWQPAGHGGVDFTIAIAQSCNTAFMTMAARAGAEAVGDTAKMLGFGRATGIDLPGEAAGLVPSPSARRARGRRWYPGDTCQLGIGQGGLLVTAAQAARMIAAVANGGYLVRPHLYAPAGAAPQQGERVPVSQQAIFSVRRGLERVVSEGTASVLRACKVSIAGKTGTAQTSGGEAHAWFVGYAPRDDPQVCIAVVVEHGGSGAGTAAPIAGRLLEQALSR